MEQRASTESTSDSREQPTAQSAYLSEFSAEQTKSLTTSVPDAINSAIEPINGHLDKKLGNIESHITDFSSETDQLHVLMIEQMAFQGGYTEKPNFGGMRPQHGLQPRVQSTRWRPEVLRLNQTDKLLLYDPASGVVPIKLNLDLYSSLNPGPSSVIGSTGRHTQTCPYEACSSPAALLRIPPESRCMRGIGD